MAATINNSIGGGGLGLGSTSKSTAATTTSLLKPQLKFPPHHQFQFQYPTLYSTRSNPDHRLCFSTSDPSSFSFNFNLKDSINSFGFTSYIKTIFSLLWKTGKAFAYFDTVRHKERRYFTLRIVLRDDDHEVERRLTELVETHKGWKKSDYVSILEGGPRQAEFIVHESVGCLLENADLWVCSASQVSLTYKQLYENLSALLEEEPFELLISERTKDQIDCVEFILHLCVIDAISDRGIHTHADLAELLQQLQTIYKGHFMSAIPECKSFKVDQEKLDKVQGYSHSTVGQQRL